jgi:hypothetical protein
MINTSAKPQTSDFKPSTFKVKLNSELIIKFILKHFPYLKFQNSFRELIIIILHHLSHKAHHILFVMENMGIIDYMANGM